MKNRHHLRQSQHPKIDDAKSGFTLVELTLTLAFVSVLLIVIAIITTNIITVYQKGMTIKAVDSVGRGLISELVSSINASPSVDTTSLCNGLVETDTERAQCITDHSYKYIYQSQTNSAGDPLYGVFCTGSYSYIWNTKVNLEDSGAPLRVRYQTSAGTFETPADARLLRFDDPHYRLCSASVDNRYRLTGAFAAAPSTHLIDITKLPSGTNNVLSSEPTGGFLNAFDLDLMLYDFTIFPVSQDNVSLRTYMSGTFVLATERGDIDIQRTGDYCTSATEDASSLGNLGSEFNYCAINKFNFAARTAGV